MDYFEEKRAAQLVRFLAETFVLIRRILANLDEILLPDRLAEEEGREPISGDLMMVARDILPRADAPVEIRSAIRSAIADWVVLSDLITLAQHSGITPRKLETMEEVAERMASILSVVHDMDEELFEDREE